MNRSRPRRARRVAGTGLIALLAGFAACYAPPAADAAITAFALSPHAGPPGTVVHVSGAGCNPGLLGSSQTDFVSVNAPTLRVVLRAPVSANGSWSGSFTVPADGGSGSSAAVAAVCVSSGLQSLTTIYSPQTFTVTAPPATTTPGTSTTRPGTGGTTPGSTPTPGTLRPDHPSTVVADPSAGPHVTGDTAGTRVTSPGDTGSPAGSHAPSTTGPASGKTKHSASAGAATLQQADLGSYVGSGDESGLGWLSGLLLLALLIAAIGAPSMIWRARRARKAATDGEAV
jgi:hypothetical protein